MAEQREAGGGQVEDSAVLTWRVFRAAEHPRKTWFAVAFIFLVLLVVALGYRSPLLVLVALLVLLAALNSYFLPTTYTLDQHGLTVNKTLFRFRRRWSEFRSFIRTSGGIVLSPFRAWTYLDNFRGVHLLLPAEPEPVLKYLAARLPEKKRPRPRTKSTDPDPRA